MSRTARRTGVASGAPRTRLQPGARVDNTASVRVEVFRDGKHTFTDYLLLYKFADGWKIVSKAFYSHPR